MNRISTLLFALLFLSSCAALQPADRSTTGTSAAKPSKEEAEIVAFAKRYKGAKYQYGGTGPKKFDCSGFTSYVYRQFDIELPRQSGMQEKAGEKISRREARPGDLVFFRKSKTGKVFHVALIISNDRDGLVVIHATSSRGVVIDNIDQSTYWKNKYMTFRRVR